MVGSRRAKRDLTCRVVLGRVVTEAARRFDERPVVVERDGTTLSYRDLDRRSDATAAALAQRGVREGDVVALVRPSDADWLVSMVAIAKCGAAVAGINPGLAPLERARVLARSTARLALVETSLLDGIGDEAGEVEVIAGDPPTADPDDAPAPLPHDPERMAAIVFTSGSTGVPKGAVFREAHLEAAATIDGIAEGTWGGGGPMMASTPFPHVGFVMKALGYVRLGATLHTLPRWRADDVWRLVERAHLTTLGAVAPQIALLLRSPLADEVDRSLLRTVIAGGAASPPALISETTTRLGVTYSVRYSSTESGGVGLSVDWVPGDEPGDAIGRPRRGVEAELRNADGTAVVEDGEPGELWVRSPAVFGGYLGDPDATAAVLVDGWWRSGDLGVNGPHGIRLVGRAKEMYVRGGYNVYPGEVEAVLRDHPDLADVAVTPRPDDVMGEVGVAVVVVREGRPAPGIEALRAFAAERLARWKLPDSVLEVPALPLTSMHKVDRAALGDLPTPPTPGR